MREELSFRGNQLNQINTVFTVGYTIGQVPCNIALYYVKPRYFFPTCMVRNREASPAIQLNCTGSMGYVDNGHSGRSEAAAHHGDSLLSGYLRVVHIRWNSLYSWVLVHGEGARQALWNLHRVWVSRNDDWWIHPDWYTFQHEWSQWPFWLEMAVSVSISLMVLMLT
jgi:hypothetical protein